MNTPARLFLSVGLLSLIITPGTGPAWGAETAISRMPAPHAVIAGGYANAIATNSASSTIGGGDSNAIRNHSPFSTIGGGRVNTIHAGSASAAIAGGNQNAIAGGGAFSTIGGGWANIIQTNAVYAVIDGGFRNEIGTEARGAVIAGGATNQVSSDALFSVIAGGGENTISTGAYDSVVGGGSGNLIETHSAYATIGGGRLNRIQASYATVAGGNGNQTKPKAFYATIPGGLRAQAASFGQFAYASGRFSVNGDAQTSLYVLRQITSDQVPTELFLDGTVRRMEVPVGGAWAFDILIVARDQKGASSGFQLQGMIENDHGTTRLVGTPHLTPLGDNTGWQAIVQADDENDALVIRVVGQANTRIRWVASVRTVEVTY